MERIEFEKVYMVYQSLFDAFHDENNVEYDDDGDPITNSKFHSLLCLFLVSVNWEEEEFYEQLEAEMENSECTCGAQDHEHDETINELDTSIFNTPKAKETLN